MGQSKRQKCNKKKGKKSAKPAEKGGNWAELPPNVIEKIIVHAVKGDKLETEPEFNWHALRVYKYGQVHPAWKDAICFSRNIFQCNVGTAEVFLQHHVFFVFGGNSDENNLMPRPFLEDGYLQAVKAMAFFFNGKPRGFDLQILLDSIAARNSLEELNIIIARGISPTELACHVIEMLTQMKSMTKFAIQIKVETQAQAKWLWKVMRLAVHTTSRPKVIVFKCLDDWKGTGLVGRHSATSDSIGWSFINHDERLKVGSIKELRADEAPDGFFDRLAKIDKLVVELDFDFWCPENRFLEETKARNLQIRVSLDDEGDCDTMYNKLRCEHTANKLQNIEVETVEYMVVGFTAGGGNNSFKSPPFENNAEVWEKVKDKLLPIVDCQRVFNERQKQQQIRQWQQMQQHFARLMHGL